MNKWVCTDCGARKSEKGECTCGGGPLLDIEDRAVRETLSENDDRRVEKRSDQLKWVGVAAGFGAIVAGLFVEPLRLLLLALPMPIPFGNPIKYFLFAIAVALGLWKGLEAVFPAKRMFPELRA